MNWLVKFKCLKNWLIIDISKKKNSESKTNKNGKCQLCINSSKSLKYLENVINLT